MHEYKNYSNTKFEQNTFNNTEFDSDSDIKKSHFNLKRKADYVSILT